MQYYDAQAHTSNLFGHYVRTTDPFKQTDPARINWSKYMVAAAPLSNALNTILSLIIPHDEDSWDIYAICQGKSLIFRHPEARERCMAVFALIEKAYPRKQYRTGSDNTKAIMIDTPVQQWKPYNVESL